MDGMGLQLSSYSVTVIAFVGILYVVTITLFGSYFSRFNKSINDFFYSGNRFAWWLPAASMIATGIGSYSYLKYSEQGYTTGMSSTMIYLNDWFVMPFFLFGWLPIIYYSRVHSIPEYFARRFNVTAKYIALTIILSYMLFYIGYNFYSMGVALQGMFGISQLYTIPALALFLGAYVTFGGQTAVIFTDLFQGIMLYLAGGLAIFSGIYALGGFSEFWFWLPVSHRLPFVHLTENPQFNTASLFWGEALAGSIAYSFMNQGFIMRFLTIKSVDEGRKAGFFNVIVTLPISAIVVGGVGWIGQALVTKQTGLGGALEGYDFINIQNTFHTFIIVCWVTVKQNPWIFGFIVAALMAALMSTIDTLINACAAIGIYDLYKPLVKPEATDEHYLKAARWASVIATLAGVLLVIWFNGQQGSLMAIHYKGIMVIIPAIVTTIFMGAFWDRFNGVAACLSMIFGSLLTVASLFLPQMIDPVAWLVSAPITEDYIYLRSLFGMIVTAIIGGVATLVTDPPSPKQIEGLTINSIDASILKFKGSAPSYAVGGKVNHMIAKIDPEIPFEEVRLCSDIMSRLAAKNGDMVYIEDSRWYLGGLRSLHVKAYQNDALQAKQVGMSPSTFEAAYFIKGQTIKIEKII